MAVSRLRRDPPAARIPARPAGVDELLRELDASTEVRDDGGWSLGYADLLLLLLTLFAVLLGMSLLSADDPGTVPLVDGLHLGSAPPAPAELDPKVLLAVLNTRPAPLASGPVAPPASAPVAETPPASAPRPPAPPQRHPVNPVVLPEAAVAGPLDRVAGILSSQGGDRLELFLEGGDIRMEVGSSILFPSGSARLTADGRRLLDDLAPTLMREDLEISVEGHTDDRPIHSRRFRSNWELSSLRATEVVRYLVAKGVSPARIHATGYGDTRPRVANDTPAHRAMNRRVSILLHLPVQGRGVRGRRL